MTLSRSMGWGTYIWYQVPDYLDISPPCNPGPRLREYRNSNFNSWLSLDAGSRSRFNRAVTQCVTTELRGPSWSHMDQGSGWRESIHLVPSSPEETQVETPRLDVFMALLSDYTDSILLNLVFTKLSWIFPEKTNSGSGKPDTQSRS